VLQRVLLIGLCLLWPVVAQATLPTLPQLTVDTTMPSTSVTKTVCASGCDYTNSQLQTAIDDAVLGTKILLQAGISYTAGNSTGYLLRNKTSGSGWIIIQTNTTLPAAGTRATSTDAVPYAKILKNSLYAMSCDATAHHYRIIGVEFMNPGDLDVGSGGTAFVNCDAQETTLATQAHHILFDRIYMHGPPAGHSIGVKFGLVLNGQYQGVIDSTIVDITYDTDAIAVANWAGAGPTLIRNNTLSSSGENIMFGGSYALVPDLSPSDITITHNYLFKPLKWRDDPTYNTNPHKILCKNLFELKHAKRLLLDGNVLENMWPSAQEGFAITIGPRQGGATNLNPQTTIQDVTITNNLIKNTSSGVALNGFDYGTAPSTTPTLIAGGRWLIKNNLFVGQGGYNISGISTGKIFQLASEPFDITIQHNTVASSAPIAGGLIRGYTMYFGDAYGSRPITGVILQDNIFLARYGPWFMSGAPLNQGQAWDSKTPGYIWTNTVWAGPWPSAGGYNNTTYMKQGSGNAYPADEAVISYTNVNIDDYSLSATSPYKNAGSDGTDIGVNWPLLQAALGGSSGGPSDQTAPLLTSSFPTIDLPAGTTSVSVTVTSDEVATVKYGLSDVAYASLPSTATANGLSYTTASISGLTNGSSTPVYFRAQDPAGNTNLTSLVVTVNVANSTADTTPPGNVTGLAGTSLSNGTGIVWTWNQASGGDVAKYQLYLCTPTLCSPTVPAGGLPTGLTVTITALLPSTVYAACVKAIDTSNNFSAACSSTVEVTTLAAVLPGAPLAPTGVKVLASHPSVARNGTFLWAHNIEADLAGYRIYPRLDPGVYGTMIKELTPAIANAEQHPLEQWRFVFIQGGAHCFAITAFNNAGVESIKSIEVCVTGVGMNARSARQ